jgi:hypothetical protein
MKRLNIVNCATRSFHKVAFKAKKHSPEILVVTGTIGVIASTVMACKASDKARNIVNETKRKLDAIEEVKADHVDDGEYTEADYKKAAALTCVKAGVELGRLYAMPVALGALSIGCILTSHNIMRKRNIALAAAYATVDRSFKDYRSRVVDRFGEALDKELKYNIKTQEIEEKIVDENGEEKTVRKTVEVIDPSVHSDYARFYDDGCKGWEKNPEYNLMFLRQIQNWANERLKARGYLYLNEVYEMLGIPQTKAGHEVGWVYDEENPIGDNFVDFGIYDLYNERTRAFVNGYEKVILLDFNVDGVISDLIY